MDSAQRQARAKFIAMAMYLVGKVLSEALSLGNYAATRFAAIPL